jgi:NAD(P)-dependent dehydrogenase (short-subunit alcohol dehydrogenase family)
VKRVCLITGAAGVLGTTFCRQYRGEYDIAAIIRTRPVWVPSQSRQIVDPLAPGRSLDGGAQVYEIRVDLDTEAALEHAVDTALARFGHVDVLVTSAVRYGVSRIDEPGFADLAMAQYWTNAVMPARLAAVLAQRCWRGREAENRAARRGVIHVSSTAARGRSAETPRAGYAASKAALGALVQHQAVEMRPLGVRVNALAPGTFGPGLPVATVADRIVDIDRGSGNGDVVFMETVP